MDQSKLTTKFGDEPDLLFNRAQGRNSLLNSLGASSAIAAAAQASINIQLEATFNDCESGYVPTVGRWGAEWPS
ncbi:uncharacterized protein Dmoj_GI26812 [Drosophila mojavensis]|uniref:Uncharacterized protein n=3 Tax=Drosophila mojavensis TaxID=7230 RepID=A0A0Q9XGH2_DROMO|nr:uncharacterized protein Dmoj_GI26812 [Drosophila mojavensis]